MGRPRHGRHHRRARPGATSRGGNATVTRSVASAGGGWGRRLRSSAPVSWDEGADLTPAPAAQLPAAEADRWERFVDRAAEVNHTAHDDLTQIDGWYETPPPPRRRHRRPPP